AWIRARESSVPGNRQQYPQTSSGCAELSKNRGRQLASGGLDTRSTYSAQYCSLVTEAARVLVTDVAWTAGCRRAGEWSGCRRPPSRPVRRCGGSGVYSGGMSPASDFLPTEIADLPLLRIASDLSAMAWEQMTAGRGALGASLDESVVDTKSSPNDLVTLADAQIESLVRGFLAEVRPNDLMVGEEGAAALDPVEFFPEEFLAELSCFDQEVGRLVEQSEPGSRLE